MVRHNNIRPLSLTLKCKAMSIEFIILKQSLSRVVVQEKQILNNRTCNRHRNASREY
jgi:hypothetical protein